MRVSSMIAANALLAKNPWNRLRPSLVQSAFAKELLRESSLGGLGSTLLPDNVREALEVGDKWYDDAVVITSRYVNQYFQKELNRARGGGAGGTGTGGAGATGGDAVYTSSALDVYDRYVWGFNSPFLWRIHAEEIKGLYNDCILLSKNHCEVGVGTGLFLRELNVPDTLTNVVLLDSNVDSLESAYSSLVSHPHYEYSQVRFQKLQGDILLPPPYELRDKFDSVSANFLLHCLGGGSGGSMMRTCPDAIENLAALLHPQRGVLFGSTILGQAVLDDAAKAGPAALETLQLYNDLGIFGNLNHSYKDLSRILHDTFDDVELWRAGYCAVFKARHRRRR